ncbi:MAG TPA: hypothetical protein VH639_29165 [Bryobacteraceae bacterium]
MGAGIWGLIVLSSLYFLFDAIGRWYPPQVAHPDFYYGFIAVSLAWQIAFLLIGTDPARFLPMMVPAICEKALYVISLAALYLAGRIELGQLGAAAPDLVIGFLFVAAACRLRGSIARSGH